MSLSDDQSHRAGRAATPSKAPTWITPELIEKTRDLWGKRYGIAIGSEEAVAIILRVGTLVDVLTRR